MWLLIRLFKLMFMYSCGQQHMVADRKFSIQTRIAYSRQHSDWYISLNLTYPYKEFLHHYAQTRRSSNEAARRTLSCPCLWKAFLVLQLHTQWKWLPWLWLDDTKQPSKNAWCAYGITNQGVGREYGPCARKCWEFLSGSRWPPHFRVGRSQIYQPVQQDLNV